MIAVSKQRLKWCVIITDPFMHKFSYAISMSQRKKGRRMKQERASKLTPPAMESRTFWTMLLTSIL